ncbi:MAG TPA: 4-hydroxythreonine-4-phosphate dehydrogenase PdxA [Chryseosolibacter sp.]
MTHTKPRIGITLGDPNGIGPEVVIKALSDNRILSLFTPVVYGSAKAVSHYKKLLNIEELNYTQVRTKGQLAHKAINVVNCWEESLEINPGKATPEAGKAAFVALKSACEDLKEGHLDALVTAPIDKKTIHSEEFPFKGHTEYLTQFFGSQDSLMFMVSDKLKIGLVTEHVPVSQVSSLLTKERIEAKIALMENSLKKDFGVVKPKIAVLGLNPHAGDNGLIGQEDELVVKTVVNESRNKGRLVFGPFPADGFFGTAAYLKYDGVLAMYHDQGLIPFKSIAFEDGINFTAGLSVVRTSPDHGTAFAIAGKNQASENSLREAIYRAGDIFRHRTEPSKEK